MPRLTFAILFLLLLPIGALAQELEDSTPPLADKILDISEDFLDSIPVEPLSPAEKARHRYNQGVMEAKQGNYTQATAPLTEALDAEDLDLQRDAFINLGNVNFGIANEHESSDQLDQAIGSMEKSIEHYKSALTLDHTDATAKRNLELALGNTKRLKVLLEEQEKEQDDQQDDQNDQNDDSEDNEEGDKDESESEDEQNQKNEDQKNEDQEKQDDASDQQDEKQENEEQENGDNQEQENQGDEQDEQNDSQDNSGQENEDEQSDQNQSPEQSDDPSSQSPQESAGKPQPVELSPQDIQSLLGQFERTEKDSREQLMWQLQGSGKKPTKNW